MNLLDSPVESFTHRGYTYNRVGVVERRRAVWRSQCMTCGSPFEFTAWFDDADSKPVSVIRRCRSCRDKLKDRRAVNRRKAREVEIEMAVRKAVADNLKEVRRRREQSAEIRKLNRLL